MNEVEWLGFKSWRVGCQILVLDCRGRDADRRGILTAQLRPVSVLPRIAGSTGLRKYTHEGTSVTLVAGLQSGGDSEQQSRAREGRR